MTEDVGTVLGMILVCTFISHIFILLGFKNLKSFIIRFFVTLAIGSILGLFLGCLINNERRIDIENWNNGYCIECNGEWRLADVVHYRNSGDTFYWSCNNCGKVISTKRKFK